jgi:hypothetical protein
MPLMPTKTEKQTWTAEARYGIGGWRVARYRRGPKGKWLHPSVAPEGVRYYFTVDADTGLLSPHNALAIPPDFDVMGRDAASLAAEYQRIGDADRVSVRVVKRARGNPYATLRLTYRVPVRVYRRPTCRAKDAVRTMGDLCDLYGSEPARLDRTIYKATDCGASVGVLRESGKWVYGTDLRDVPRAEQILAVKFSSIVEGIDATADGEEVEIPCRLKAVVTALADVEAEAARLWEETHGCEGCGSEGDTGYIRVNAACDKCHGAGTII